MIDCNGEASQNNLRLERHLVDGSVQESELLIWKPCGWSRVARLLAGSRWWASAWNKGHQAVAIRGENAK